MKYKKFLTAGLIVMSFVASVTATSTLHLCEKGQKEIYIWGYELASQPLAQVEKKLEEINKFLEMMPGDTQVIVHVTSEGYAERAESQVMQNYKESLTYESLILDTLAVWYKESQGSLVSGNSSQELQERCSSICLQDEKSLVVIFLESSYVDGLVEKLQTKGFTTSVASLNKESGNYEWKDSTVSQA